MKNASRLIIVFLLTGVSTIQRLDAWFSSAGSGYPGEYLTSLGASAAGMGLGLAQTSMSGNSFDIFGNPAGLAPIEWQEGSISVLPLFAQSQFMFMSYAYPLKDDAGLGFGFARLTSGDAEKTNELGEITGSFSDQETAFMLGYGFKFRGDLFIGANAKFISQDIDYFSAKSAGADIGLIYTYTPEHTWSLVIQNILPPKLGPDGFPVIVKIGFQRNLLKKKLDWYTDISMQDFMKSSGKFNWFTGAEYAFIEWFKARIGLNSKQVSAGLGVSTREIDFDYALAYHPLDFLHMFTITVRYGFMPTLAEKKVREDWAAMKSEKEEYFREKQRQEDSIRFERERLKRETRLANMFFDAKSKYENKNYGAARRILEDIIREDPGHDDAKQLLADIKARMDEAAIARHMQDAKKYYGRNLFNDVLRELNYVLESQPGNPDAMALMFLSNAHIYLIDRKYNDAKGELIEVLKINPNNAEATQLLKRVQTIMDINGGQ